eukprot:1140527-Prorocentrum_lima.AAC.1
MGVGHIQVGKEGGGKAKHAVRGRRIKVKAGSNKDIHSSCASNNGNTACTSIFVSLGDVCA